MKTAGELFVEKSKEMITVSPDVTIYEALKVMTDNKIGAILVKDNGKISGIWTERDLMHNILDQEFDPKTAKIKDYMQTVLFSADYTETILQLQDKFLGRRLRHLLIKRDEEYLGILSVGDVVRASLNVRMKELKELKAIVSWEYYEDWKWQYKKR